MRISHEISEKNKGVSEIVLLGIKRRVNALQIFLSKICSRLRV